MAEKTGVSHSHVQGRANRLRALGYDVKPSDNKGGFHADVNFSIRQPGEPKAEVRVQTAEHYNRSVRIRLEDLAIDRQAECREVWDERVGA